MVCGGSVFGPCVVVHYLKPFLVYNYHYEDEGTSCYTLIVFLMSCDNWSSVAFPQDYMGLSAVCDCGISRLYLLTTKF